MEHHHSTRHHSHKMQAVPQLLQDIMDVEHLWHYNDNERVSAHQNHPHNENHPPSSSSSNLLDSNSDSNGPNASNGNRELSRESPPEPEHRESASSSPNGNSPSTTTATSQHPDFLSNLCNIADHRLYKIVKWCKSLPLFKNISIDDQICLLINSWCELLLFSCCFRSMSTPGEIRVSLGKSITLEQARQLGLESCIERMLAFTNNLRRLRVDQYEYVAMKVTNQPLCHPRP